MCSRSEQIRLPEPARHKILKMAGFLDGEGKSLAADFDLSVAAALSLAATLPELDLEGARLGNGEFPLRPVVRIDPVTEAVFVRGGFVTQHHAMGCGVASEQGEGARGLLRDRLAFGCRPKRHSLEVHHRAALERTATRAQRERLGAGQIKTA